MNRSTPRNLIIGALLAAGVGALAAEALKIDPQGLKSPRGPRVVINGQSYIGWIDPPASSDPAG